MLEISNELYSSVGFVCQGRSVQKKKKNNKFAQNCIAQSVGLLGRKGSVIGK
jgi:hypothetical protein